MKKFFEKNHILVILFSISFVFLCVFAWWMHHINELCDHTNHSIEDNINLYSPWGDSFAPFNVVISFLSVIGLIVTIYIQMKGNKEQSNSSKEQWILSYKQNFDTNFYNFISMLDNMKKNIHKNSDIILSIRDMIYDELEKNNPGRVNEKKLEEIKEKIFSYKMPNFGYSFTYETNIIFIENIILHMKKINNNNLLDELEKRTYINVLFSSLDEDTLLLISLYAIYKEDFCIQEIIGKFDIIKCLISNTGKYGIITALTYFYYGRNKI